MELEEKGIISNNTNETIEKVKIISNSPENDLDSYVLSNANGLHATILNYGATIARLEVPDRNGKIENIILGHQNLADFVGGPNYLGATIGRYANRIAGGQFQIDGKVYRLKKNNKGSLLHGGAKGFDKKFWEAKILKSDKRPMLKLSLTSPDGEEGFPGTLEITVIYSLNYKNELKIEYKASTNKPTVINLTNHSYFNLTGPKAYLIHRSGSILHHILRIDADKFTPVNDRSIPTGEIESVDDTPLDFKTPCKIGDRIDDDFMQLKYVKGYDHNWVLNNYDGTVREVASLYDVASGRLMKVLTDQPGLQFYSGNYLDGTIKGDNNIYYRKRSGLCLECQHFPNSPNEKNFPSTVLRPGRTYSQTTIYKFQTN